MYCRECGHEVNNNAEICPNCGVRPLNGDHYCQSCGEKTSPNQEMCTNCGTKLLAHRQTVGKAEDNPSGLLNLTVCCFPIVGIILYFIWKDEKPKSAKSVCKWAIIGTVIGVVLYIVFFALGFFMEMMYYL